MQQSFKIGSEVLVCTNDIVDKKGVIKFIGKIEKGDKIEEYIGVELDEPVGKNAGDYEGKQYFKVDKKSKDGMFGVFVKAKWLKFYEPKKVEQVKKAVVAGTVATKGKGQRPSTQKNKLSNEIAETQGNELSQLKEELEAAYDKINQYDCLDTNKEVQSLRTKLKELEDINRSLKAESQKVKYSVDCTQQQKLKDLNEKIGFFNSQKEFSQKQRNQLKKKVVRLEAELQAQQEKDEMLDKLTIKIQHLQTKSDKLKQQLETSNTQLKNYKFQGSNELTVTKEQIENIEALNEMIALLESDLGQQKDKNKELRKGIQGNAGKVNEIVKLERKLKSREEEIQALKLEVQSYSDAASFAEKLTLDMIAKEQSMSEKTKRLKEFVGIVQQLQNQASETQQIVDLQAMQMQCQQEQIQKLVKEKVEQQNHINQLNTQMSKYKQKIRELSDNNSTLMISMSEQKQEDSLIKYYLNNDVYQHKYYELLKLHQQTNQRFLEYQLQFAAIRNQVGVYMVNLVDTLPETFTNKFYPEIVAIIMRVKSTNDKLYLLFETVCSNLKEKAYLYSKDNADLASWLIMIIQQIPMLYGLLYKIELAITCSDTQEQVAQILSCSQLKEDITRVDLYASELLQRITTQNIDVEVGFDPFIQSIDSLDRICMEIKRLPTQFATKLDLCTQTMRGVHQLFSSIYLYKSTSEVQQTAQVDTMIDNFLKMLINYLRECCTNPHIRLKSDMKNYLNGIDLVVKILKQIQLNESVHELSSLYSDIQDIKMLKETILTTQFHLKELMNDLDQITYSSPLSRIQLKLPGKIWQDRMKNIKAELNKFQETIAQKEQLQKMLSQQKKKVLILQKEIKDRQVTKELHEKRIGQLHLKVEQSSLLQNQLKRQGERIKSIQEDKKIIEDQLNTQTKRKKDLEEELKKNKQKYDICQTEAMMKHKKQKANQSLSSEDLANLTIFKSVLTECNALRSFDLKKKVHELKYSPILHPPKPSTVNPEVSSLRRKVMQRLTNLKLQQNCRQTDNEYWSIVGEVERFAFQKKVQSQETVQLEVGNLLLRDLSANRMRVEQDRSSMVSY